MSEFAVGLDLDDEDRLSLHGFLPPSTKIHVNDMEPEEGNLIRKTVAMMPQIAAPVPHSTDRTLSDRVTIGLPIPPALAEIESNLQTNLEKLHEIKDQIDLENPPELHTLDFPNLALEAVKAGLEKERISNNQIDNYIKEAEKHQKDIDLLLDFSAELSGQKEDTEISEKLKDLLAQLKERGIDLWKSEEKNLTREKISELKSMGSAQIDQLRSKLQIVFASKLPGLIQAVTTIMQTIQEIIRNHSRLITTILGKMSGR